MKKILIFLIAVFLLSPISAAACTFAITPADAILAPDLNSQVAIESYIKYIYSADKQYIANAEGEEESYNPYANYYHIENMLPMDDVFALYTINDVVSPIPPTYLSVKDGDHDRGWYLFDLAALGWDGVETTILDNFWPSNGTISNVFL